MNRPDSVSAAGEDRLVAGVVSRLSRSVPPWLRVGPGDDAAVLALGAVQAAGLVASTDTLVQDRDFRLHTASGVDVGVKAAAQNFADIAAMGARPIALLVSLALPGNTPTAWADGLSEGLDRECGRAGATVIGGDVSDASEIVVTGTALGTLDGLEPVLRSGAQPGDVVALAGLTGPSAAGLALLEAGTDLPDDVGVAGMLTALITAHRRPRPPYQAGPAAGRAGATALIDTSDGLVRDASRIATASGVTIDLDPALLGPGPDLLTAAGLLQASAQDWVLTGGEDHALLACFGAGTSLPPAFRPIGRVLGPGAGTGRDGVASVLVGGQPWAGSTGWTHFA